MRNRQQKQISKDLILNTKGAPPPKKNTLLQDDGLVDIRVDYTCVTIM